MICAGIDGGSRTLKVVLFDGAARSEHTDGEGVIASSVHDQAVDQSRLATAAFDELLAQRSLRRADVERIIATGYARNRIKLADTTVTEITCHAVGVRHQVPGARTVVEIGGQDSKLLRLDAHGTVRDFVMNDRCAAGSGRFLEMVAMRLDATLGELGDLADRATTPAAISSMCVVFAETEIIGLLASGRRREDIVAGVQRAIASRLATMAGDSLEEPIIFTGGVALIPGMRAALEATLQCPIATAPQPLITGALGAAILAARQCPV